MLKSDSTSATPVTTSSVMFRRSFVFGVKQAVGQGGVIAENNPNFAAKGLGSNGQGIDHGEDAYGPSVGAAIGFCTA